MGDEDIISEGRSTGRSNQLILFLSAFRVIDVIFRVVVLGTESFSIVIGDVLFVVLVRTCEDAPKKTDVALGHLVIESRAYVLEDHSSPWGKL